MKIEQIDWKKTSDREAAQLLDLPVQEVRAARRALGHLRRRNLTDADRDYLAEAYPAGVPVGTIASHLGRSTATVYTLARGMGLQRPGGSGTGRPREK